MGKIMAVDYGKKRCGIAVTDELQIIASGLQTVETVELFPFLTGYFAQNRVEAIVVGLPIDLKGNLSEIEQEISGFIEKFKLQFPEIEVYRFDERFTSKMASFFISQSGKNKRKEKKRGWLIK